MIESKFNQLLAKVRAEIAPVPPTDFAADVVRTIRMDGIGPVPRSASLFEQLNRLFPRLASLSAAVILLCVAGDFVCTFTGLPEMSEATAQLAADTLLDTGDL